ncbi:MAG: SDR family oxidoreductase [Candidatus Latescibacteria bacterium]|nr:SDR family oxidoreductase [Candidatus Latescibacterota bacterium]
MRKRFRFQDKVVIVTGASSGIGRDTAVCFAREGAQVVLAARSREGLEETANLMSGGEALIVPTDVTKRDEVDRLIGKTIGRYGRVDILVNNAGVGYFGPVATMPQCEIERVMQVNFSGLVSCTQAVLPSMIEQRQGQIINISSVVGKRAFSNIAIYSASKFAVNGFTEALRLEVARYGIDVILICPTSTNTIFFERSGSDGTTPKRARSPVVMRSETVAETVVNAAARRKREVVLSYSARFFLLVNKFMPGVVDWGLRRMARE